MNLKFIHYSSSEGEGDSDTNVFLTMQWNSWLSLIAFPSIVDHSGNYGERTVNFGGGRVSELL
jgi:hypothetical protein